jgi:hypothetical protein
MNRFACGVVCMVTSSVFAQVVTTPDACTTLLHRASGVTSIAMTLDTPAGATGKPERIVLALDNRKRLAFAQYRSQDGTTYPATPVAMLHFADGTSRNQRVGRDVYIENTQIDLWGNIPPRPAMFAPWPVLATLHAHALTDGKHELAKTDAGCSLRSPAYAFSLDASADGTLTSVTLQVAETTWSAAFVDASPVQIGETTISLPARIIERENDKAGERTTTWTVTSLEVNPADIDQRLAFDAAGMKLNKWDVEAGKIFDASGKQVGIEEIPAARSVETWEVTTKASAWIAVWKWGSIIAGLGLVGFVLDMIRRRL